MSSVSSIDIEDDVTFMRREFNEFLDDYGWNVTLKHFTGMTPPAKFNKYYNALDVNYEDESSRIVTESTILVVLQYPGLPKREERETITTMGSMINRVAFCFVKNDVTVEVGDQIVDDNDETFRVEYIREYKISKSDSTPYIIYKQLKIQKTVDVLP